ncbi:hypothetical protein DL239_09895 [Sedimentitalea sp. CY04]|uniref:Probable membrane transporter protein n=1 Tax=Parasedimentitalea denitrificans TaxID=2211118 RepID=A0ABX0W6M1_9RHOB|nr:sulfite exporter TauE/SafE family protein [Sedimentitalea sp. CY04]NIZ61284.1 hypothetical protein [Sedimentitalea sp. CY04]
MLDVLYAALETPGLIWMVLTIAAAGIVRGFTGFGTAMIFVPVAGMFLPPAEVILVIATTGIFSTIALVPGAWKIADRGEVAALSLSAMVTVPLGLWLLSQLDAMTIRWIVTVVVSLTLLAVVTGWRWHGRLGWPGRFAIGGAGGTIGGLTGLTGPVVIIFYLANARSAQAVRANTILFLAATDIIITTGLFVSGQVTLVPLAIALLLSLPYLVTTLIGQSLFDPKLERFYRVSAYSVIALAVVSGLPLFD